VEYSPREGDVTGSRCGVQSKSLKMALVFLKEEKVCYKMVYFILCLGKANRVAKLEFTDFTDFFS